MVNILLGRFLVVDGGERCCVWPTFIVVNIFQGVSYAGGVFVYDHYLLWSIFYGGVFWWWMEGKDVVFRPTLIVVNIYQGVYYAGGGGGQYLPGPFLEQRLFGSVFWYVSGDLVNILSGQYFPGPFLEQRHFGCVFHGYVGKIQFGQYLLVRFWWV